MVDGRLIRVSTGCRSRKEALKVEARIRDQIALGKWGILERNPAPKLGDFLRESFIPWVPTSYENKNSRANYLLGARHLMKSNLADVPMDEITSEHTARYVSEHRGMSPSGINAGLRSLQKSLSLAVQWKRIDRRVTVPLMKERRRERVLTEDEEDVYIASCSEPWRTIAILMLELGLRPDEAIRVKAEDLDLERKCVHVRSGKTEAARRTLTLTERAIEALPPTGKEPGYLFSGRQIGSYVSQSKLWNQHEEAIRLSKVDHFEPYVLRHTCLTRMGEYTPLPTLAVIAGHTDIKMTMRYVHPQAKSIEAAFKESESRHKFRQRRKMHVVKKERKYK